MRTPETLTAASRAATLKLHDNALDQADATKSPVTSKNQSSYQDRARHALESVEGPTNATAHIDLHGDEDLSLASLSIDDIEVYEHNTRQSRNPKYEDIRKSILADGITNILTVTRSPSATRYHPYGGGNTRLEIAKEAFATGDQRFQRLQVVIKKWPGHAKVIAAHMSENDNRGDTTFWEKACAVVDFKQKFEAEHETTLTANDLNKELKALGLDYGVRTIHNFIFAKEHLSEIGKWINVKHVNIDLRPVLVSIKEIASKFKKDEQAREAQELILQDYALSLNSLEERNEELDESDRQPVELDSKRLIDDLQTAVAKVIGISAQELPAVLEAMARNPRMDPDGLLAQARLPQQPAMAARTATAPAVPRIAPQAPLGAMLGVVPTPQPQQPISEPSTLAPGTAPLPDGTDLSASPLDLALGHQPGVAVNSDYSEPADPEKLVTRILDMLAELAQLVPLHDVLKRSLDLPLGFFIDFPPQGLELVDGQPLPQRYVDSRSALWGILASLSGQLTQHVTRMIPAAQDGVYWAQLASMGQEAFAHACLTRAQAVLLHGELVLEGAQLGVMLTHPEIGPALSRLFTATHDLRRSFPERFDLVEMSPLLFDEA